MQAIYTATCWRRCMNKIPVYLCIAILLGQVVLFSSDESTFQPSLDPELFAEDAFSASGRNGTQSVWTFSTLDSTDIVGSASSLAINSGDIMYVTYLDDTNDDQVLTFEEYSNAVQSKYLEVADADEDGQISLAEAFSYQFVLPPTPAE